MKIRNKQRWRILKFYCIGWTLAFIFLTIVRGVGTIEEGSVDFDFWTAFAFSFVMGPMFGLISGYAQILTEERLYKCVPIQKLLILRLIFALAFIVVLVVAGYIISITLLNIKMGFVAFAFDGAGSFAIYFYILVVEFAMAILRQINLMLGDNKLGELLRGKFYTPSEEERIFMFLDLQSSTELAEKLGHVKYSMMIQDCFNDLGVVVENEAEIYQYVGDEVILTWKLDEGLRDQNCVNAYYNFKHQLASKTQYYQDKYDCVPFFKAGMNTGVVTVTEVGKYKKEIAYHGDTINTAARIQGKCNEFGEELLISECLVQKLSTERYLFDKLGSVSLRGKHNLVAIYASSVKAFITKLQVSSEPNESHSTECLFSKAVMAKSG